jgi:hypothetical protein
VLRARGVGRQEYPCARKSPFGRTTGRQGVGDRRIDEAPDPRPASKSCFSPAAVSLASLALAASIRSYAEWMREMGAHSQRVDHLETAPESVGMSAQPRSPSRPGWVAQLIGDSSETVALSRFHQLQSKLQSALGGYEPAIVRTTIRSGEVPIWVRVRIEFDTRQDADSLCAKLEVAHEPCLVQRNVENGR